MTFGHFSRRHGLAVTRLNEDVGAILAGATWVGFGALAVGAMFPHVTWRMVLYAVLSLTVVRIVPVAIALAGTRARIPTVAFMGWFGPRGLASIVFQLASRREYPKDKPLGDDDRTPECLLARISCGSWWRPTSRWYAAYTAGHPTAAPEAKPTTMSPPAASTDAAGERTCDRRVRRFAVSFAPCRRRSVRHRPH